MKRRRALIPPDYLEKLLAMLATGTPEPGAYVVTVRHDDDCDLLAGRGACSCEPEISLPERIQ